MIKEYSSITELKNDFKIEETKIQQCFENKKQEIQTIVSEKPEMQKNLVEEKLPFTYKIFYKTSILTLLLLFLVSIPGVINETAVFLSIAELSVKIAGVIGAIWFIHASLATKFKTKEIMVPLNYEKLLEPPFEFSSELVTNNEGKVEAKIYFDYDSDEEDDVKEETVASVTIGSESSAEITDQYLEIQNFTDFLNKQTEEKYEQYLTKENLTIETLQQKRIERELSFETEKENELLVKHLNELNK